MFPMLRHAMGGSALARKVASRGKPASFTGFSRFCILAEAQLPDGLRASKTVAVRLQSAAEQLKPSDARKGEKAIGVGDRGAGLVYRDGRPASSSALGTREKEAKFPREGVWVVKIQPPLDVSSDSAGGIGRITPTTLLLSDRLWNFVRFVREEDDGHFPLLRCALGEPRQVAYRYAEEFEDKGQMLRVYIDVIPTQVPISDGDHGPTKIREALGAGAGVSCGIAGRLEEVPDILEDPQVLACFLDLGSGGEVLRTGWQAALPEMSAFDAKATVRWGEKSQGTLPRWEDTAPKGRTAACHTPLGLYSLDVPLSHVVHEMTGWCDRGLQASEPLTQVSGKCPKCGAKLLADSQFCRRCGHKLMAQVEMSSAGQEGLQYLCSKYSSLITRLREEVLARQQAEAEARLLESRLREESEAWQQEKSGMIRELQQLREEIAGLQSQLLAKRLQKADSSSAGREATTAPGDAADSTWKHYQVQAQQHHQLMSLLAEHSQLQAEQQDTQAELTACQEHLTRWRRKASELESQAAMAESGRDEAERRARCVQEEMRQALRSAASAKGRQKEAERVARQEELQMRDLDERLKALRHDSRVNARRAGSAERRLASAEAAEVAAGHLESDVADLRRRLRCAEDQANELRASNLRVEQAEARSAQRAGEVKGELRAAEALNQTNSVHLKDLEVQLMTTREALAEAEADRATKSSWSKRLGHELADARAKQQEAWQVQEQQAHELREARRRLDQLVGGGTSMPGGQLAQCKRRLLDLEQACSRKEAEVAEERRAREKCHTEAVRASEKLRAARAQGAQLKERLRTLEEAELRYPSRFPPQRAKPQTSSRRPSRSFSVPAPEGRLRDGRPARPDSHTSHATHAWMQATLQTPEPLEPCQTSSTSDDVQVMKDFVKNEEARLRALSHGGARPLDPDPGSYRLSWEEQPRAALPFKAKRAKSRAKSRAFGGQASEPPALPEEDLSLATLLAMKPQPPDKTDQAAAAYHELPSEVAPVLRPQGASST
ncbi:unnamed protein product [Symbiodinium sp. KB8]|nr:unnamed protein product [Symbiodinium sp. KB8]